MNAAKGGAPDGGNVPLRTVAPASLGGLDRNPDDETKWRHRKLPAGATRPVRQPKSSREGERRMRFNSRSFFSRENSGLVSPFIYYEAGCYRIYRVYRGFEKVFPCIGREKVFERAGKPGKLGHMGRRAGRCAGCAGGNLCRVCRVCRGKSVQGVQGVFQKLFCQGMCTPKTFQNRSAPCTDLRKFFKSLCTGAQKVSNRPAQVHRTYVNSPALRAQKAR